MSKSTETGEALGAAALRRTPLYDEHVSAGARLVQFAGFELPIQYAGIREEHEAVRHGAGVFDVSHMGQIEVLGPQALECLQLLLSSDVSRIPQGGAQYALLCNERGGVLDDLFVYRPAEQRYLVVTNAANHERDLAWMREHGGQFDATLADRREDFAMLAVQGPRARAVLAGLSDGPLPERLRCASATVAGVPVLAAGTGYTGEDGLEVLCDPAHAGRLWRALLEAGGTPAGLGARDTLRLEACFHLYGNDLDEEHDPIAAGLGWACAEQTGFIGSEPIAAVRAAGAPLVLVPFVVDGPGIARRGNQVLGGGEVTSGTFAPSLGAGAGLAYVPRERATPGTRIQIDVRGTVRDAVVARKPLYPNTSTYRKDQ